jgi:predicted alpha/beta superfamily hydrolase
MYGRLIVEELKPFIDSTYRTLPDPRHTGLGGSSLGGLVSLYLGLKHPDVFGKLAVMSPSVWWDRRAVLRDVRNARPKPRLRIWVDIGTREGRHHLKAGWTEDEDLHYEEVPGASHSERAWGERLDRVIEWLFQPGV